MVFYVTMVLSHITLLIIKWLNIVMDDGWIHLLAKTPPSLGFLLQWTEEAFTSPKIQELCNLAHDWGRSEICVHLAAPFLVCLIMDLRLLILASLFAQLNVCLCGVYICTSWSFKRFGVLWRLYSCCQLFGRQQFEEINNLQTVQTSLSWSYIVGFQNFCIWHILKLLKVSTITCWKC